MVARRTDNDWVNSTKLLNVGALSVSKRVAVIGPFTGFAGSVADTRCMRPQMVDGLSRGKRDMFLKNEPDRLVFRRGALHLKVGPPFEPFISSENHSDCFFYAQGVWCAHSLTLPLNFPLLTIRLPPLTGSRSRLLPASPANTA